MVEKTFSYKDDYPCIYEGMNFYLSKFSLKKRKNYILCFIISFLVISLYNFFEILRIDDGFFTGILIFLAFAFSAVSVIYFHVYNKIHLKAVASKMFHLQKDTKKQIVLRQNDVVFLRDCCISNYYYDEFVAIIEGKKSISFVTFVRLFPRCIFSRIHKK